MSTEIHKGTTEGGQKERVSGHPEVNLSGPILFCSATNRLYFVDKSSVRYLDLMKGGGAVKLFSDEGPVKSIELVPNALLYTLSGVPGVRRFVFSNGDRSVFLDGAVVDVSSSYKTSFFKPGTYWTLLVSIQLPLVNFK